MAATPYAEVIGDPVAHSKSPIIHKFWLEKLGLDGDFVRTRVTRAELPAFLAARRIDPLWRGCSVTIPHKQGVLGLLDEVDPVALAIGAVNRVTRDRRAGARLAGGNSDWSGFLEPLRPLLEAKHAVRLAYVIGTGGAALAVCHALDRAGFTIVSVGRDRDKAAALQRRLGLLGDSRALGLDEFAAAPPVESGEGADSLPLLVNATPLGMAGYPDLPLDLGRLPAATIVYDLVYQPAETALIGRAQALGMTAIGGLEMLIGQAAEAFEAFFGKPPPRRHDEELRERLAR